MTFLRIILSLALVALGAIWTVREHLGKPFYEAKIFLEPNTPVTLEGWERRTKLKDAWAGFSEKKSWDVTRTRLGYELAVSDEDHESLKTWVEEWNSTEMARLRLRQDEHRRTTELRDRQIARLVERKGAFFKLKEDIDALAKNAPDWSKGTKDLGLSKFFGGSDDSKVEEKSPLVKDSPDPVEAKKEEAPAETEDDLEARFRMRLTDEMNRTQSFLSQGQKDLEKSLLQGQDGVVNRVAQRMASQEQRLLTLLEQQLKSLESQDRHWEESRTLVGLLIVDLIEDLDFEVANLRQVAGPPPAKATLELNVTGMEAPPEALRDSFRFFLFGMVLCFIFNLLWEMVVQRERL